MEVLKIKSVSGRWGFSRTMGLNPNADINLTSLTKGNQNPKFRELRKTLTQVDGLNTGNEDNTGIHWTNTRNLAWGMDIRQHYKNTY